MNNTQISCTIRILCSQIPWSSAFFFVSHAASSHLQLSTFCSVFIQIIIIQHHFIFHTSMMHQAWSIAEVRSLIFMQVVSPCDLVQLAATCKAFYTTCHSRIIGKANKHCTSQRIDSSKCSIPCACLCSYFIFLTWVAHLHY